MYKQTHQPNVDMLNLLKQEVELLRSLVIGTIGKDREGNYNPLFVMRILKASEKKATHFFQDKKSFLKQLN